MIATSRRRLSLAALALSLALLAGHAPGQEAPPPDRFARLRLPEDPRERFALVNVMHVLSHELGHALIHEFDIPMLGREEDAADNFATLLFLAEDSAIGRNALAAVAMGWLDMHREDEQAIEPSIFADEHGLHIQRFFQIVCLLYGSDSEREVARADEARLPEERRPACEAEYEQIRRGWTRVLQPHLRRGDAPGGGNVAVSWEEGPAAATPTVAMLRYSRAVEIIAAVAGRRLRLPRDLTITLKTCNDENAWWDADEATVTFCYEMVEHYGRLAAKRSSGSLR